MSDDVVLSIEPVRPFAPADRCEMDALVRIDVPDRTSEEDNPKPRHGLNLAFVVDASGSMRGRPLDQAKACVERAVRGLQKGDTVSVVAYSSHVEDICRPTDASHAEDVAVRLAMLRAGGMTDLHGGWLRCAEMAAINVGQDSLSRVVLLSDGCQNRGVRDPREIADQCAEMASAGVTTSTYGLGRHSFNEDLMTAMAESGQGNAYYGETAEDLLPRFDAEMGILNATMGQDVPLEVDPAAGTDARVLNAYPRDEFGYVLPDLVRGAQVWAVVRFKAPEAASSDAQRMFSVKLAWRDRETAEALVQHAKLDLPVASRLEWEAAPESTEVAARAKEVAAANAQLRVKQAVDAGAWEDVERAIQGLRAMAGDNAYVGESAEVLAEMAARREQRALAKEARYGAREMGSRYADPDERPGLLGGRRAHTRKRARKGGGR